MSAQLAIVPKDRTAAERQRRYRQRRKVQKPSVTVTPAVAIPTVTALQPKRYGFVPFALLCAALAVAAVSGSFSIIGLTAVFTGAFWPIVGMGIALETAKLSAVAWLGRRYAAPRVFCQSRHRQRRMAYGIRASRTGCGGPGSTCEQGCRGYHHRNLDIGDLA